MSATEDKAPDAGAGYELAFNEGVRALSEQQVVIDSFRTRSGLLLSGAAIATSFLGQAALDRGTTFFTWLAIALFATLGAAVIAILWPRNDWEYAIRPELLIANYIEHPEPLSLEQIHRDLALHMDRSYLRNRGQLLRLVWLFRAASILLTIEVVAWVVDLVVQA
ncbi:MAG: hypothetical protein ACRDN8_24930 [Thermoleophilaceae bacterium]